MTVSSLQNVVILGGSFVGHALAQKLARSLPATHRIVLVEPHSHFHFLFCFPRFACTPSISHKALIPYSGLFPDTRHEIVQAAAVSLQPGRVTLDREINGSAILPFAYAAVATGCTFNSPGSVPPDLDKPGTAAYFDELYAKVRGSQRIAIVGGGAVGVQMALDIKETWPTKSVVLAHSRQKLMNRFDHALSSIVVKRATELGVVLLTGSRAVVPPEGLPTEKGNHTLHLQNGMSIPADLIITATGQRPNNRFLPHHVLNPNGLIKVTPTLQVASPGWEDIYAAGDIADTGALKAARVGMAQGEVVGDNILARIGGGPQKTYEAGLGGIHLTLGIKNHVIFKNPLGGESPSIQHFDDGVPDMNIAGVWPLFGVTAEKEEDFWR